MEDTLKTTTIPFSFQRADVILIHTKGFFECLSKAIRFGTGSYWNHAAMIYLIPDESDIFKNTFMIESISQGIDIRKIDQYFEKTKKYDIGIKRLAAGWYGDGDNKTANEFARLVRGFALQEIDARYSYSVILSICRQIICLFFQGIAIRIKSCFVKAKKNAQKAAEKLRLRKRAEAAYVMQDIEHIAEQGQRINSYICSGFVQWSYFQAMRIFNAKYNDSTTYYYSQVTFSPRIDKPLGDGNINTADMDAKLLSTTPADLANSRNLKWQCIIKDNKFYSLTSENDGEAMEKIVKGKRKDGTGFIFKNGKLVYQAS